MRALRRGGHNGKDETTTLCLVPAVRKAVSIPVIAAGGIATGRAALAVMALGADGVQIGTRFVATEESSAHLAFKQSVVAAKEGDTALALKSVVPVRLIKNKFYNEIHEMESRGVSPTELSAHLGRGRAKKGMFEGNLDDGELEIGQIASIIDDILPAATVVDNIMTEYAEALAELHSGGKFGLIGAPVVENFEG